MMKLIRNLIRFRLGQKMTRSAARTMGFGAFSRIAGLIGGYRMMRRHT